MTLNPRSFSKGQRAALVAGVLVFGSLGLFGWVHSMRKEPPIPVFQVQRAEFLDALQFRGDVKATKSVTIAAPPEIGSLQIVKIVADGAQVKQGDVVVEFDASKTKQDLNQDRSVVKSSEAQIEQARAQGKLTEEEDTTAVLKARYGVESAKLDASKSEIVSKIEGAEAELKVKDAEQALRMPNPERPLQRLLAQHIFQVPQLPWRAAHLQQSSVRAAYRDPRRVIPPILQPPQPLDNDRDHLLTSDVPHDSTHALILCDLSSEQSPHSGQADLQHS